MKTVKFTKSHPKFGHFAGDVTKVTDEQFEILKDCVEEVEVQGNLPVKNIETATKKTTKAKTATKPQ